jgi:hypothetical protein
MPAVDGILRAGNVDRQGALLHAISDHPLMASAQKMANIDSSKEAAATKYIAEQLARMMEQNCSTLKLCGNSTADKRDAVEGLQGDPAEGQLQRSTCTLQHPHRSGPWN